ncbi:MAG: OprO/OprP family phosphate-selective porin [Pseudomonadota bacterium]
MDSDLSGAHPTQGAQNETHPSRHHRTGRVRQPAGPGERPEDDVASEGDEGYDLTARATWAPWLDTGRVLHLGTAVRRHEPEDSANGLRFASRPESNITDVQLVDTGVLANTEDLLSYGLELAGEWGPWSLQSEYIRNGVNRKAASDLDLQGWYVLASWFLTGESRPYKVSEGVFDRVTPTRIIGQGGIGAWELALRLSSLDLSDDALVGGEQHNLTAGVNWHLTPNVKLQANYIRVLDLDRPGHRNDGDEPSAYTVRAQVDF